MVFDDDAALGNARRAAGLEDVDWLVFVGLGDPTPHGAAAEPFVLKQGEFVQIGEAADVLTWVEGEAFGLFEPEGTSRFRG